MQKALINLFLSGILLILCIAALNAQGYYIKKYDVQAHLQLNGSVRIVETIDAHFTEEKRGIIRAIPVSYRVDYSGSGERAQRNETNGVYSIIIKDVNVKNHPFTTYTEGHELKVRIGDPDVYLDGDVTYEISYLIWGALNGFSEWVEFPFNIIGQGWDVPIENATFKVHFPTPITLKKEDFLAFTGGTGSTATNLSSKLERTNVSGRTTKSLDAYEGITISLRFPKGYFDQVSIPISEYAEQYWVKSDIVNFRLDPDGSVLVEEEIHIGFTERFLGMIRFMWRTPGDLQDYGQRYYMEDLQLTDMQSGQKVATQWNRQANAEELFAHFRPGSAERKLKLSYRLWGAVARDSVSSGIYGLYLPYAGIDGVSPIEKAEINVHFHEKTDANPSSIPHIFNAGEGWPRVDSDPGVFSYQSRGVQYKGAAGTLNFALNRSYLNLNSVPYQVYANFFVFKQIDQKLTIQKNGNVEVQQKLLIDLLDPAHASHFSLAIPAQIKSFEVSDGSSVKFPKYNLFSKHSDLHVSDLQFDTSIFTIEKDNDFNEQLKLITTGTNSRIVESTISYTLNGITRKENGVWKINFPVLYKMPEPVLNTNFEISLSGSADGLTKWDVVSDNGQILESSTTRDVSSTGQFSHLSGFANSVILSMSVSDKDAIQISVFRHFGLFWQNNPFLIIMVLVGLLLFVLWWFIGRDPKVQLNVQYYPPAGMTPAEVGWLFDDSIDQRDMISLLFYWAAEGYMIIEEIPDGKKKKKYKFIKVQNLPSSAKDYERTMFNGIFKSGSTVTTDDLKHTFYTKLKASKSELEKHGKQEKFYIPGTRGFGTCLIVLGVLVLILSILSFAVGYFLEDYSFGVAAIGTAILMFIFGRIMPKKGQLGHQKYEQLLGFHEFMERAEADRLKILLDEHPDYFSKTIAYAVAFGMAENWAGKFSDLAIEPPNWYRSPDHSTFSTIYFASSLQNSMHSIGSVMSSMPPSTTGGSGGSSFGGGFSGGGGFGGGGGSSW